MMHKFNVHIRTTLQVIIFVAVSSPSSTPNFVLSGSPITASAGPITRVSTIVGGKVELPCDTKPPKSNDSLLLVVWYRDDNPVYSYDTRLPGSTGHWMGEEFGDRAKWLGLPTSALDIHDVQSRDGATYRCRVDFQVSPTRNYRIALEVIELPSTPVIFDEYGKEISRVAGPYNEGENFKLICSVTGGNPIPRIQWLQGDNVLESLDMGGFTSSQSSRLLNLTVRNVTRNKLHTEYICTTGNTLLVPPRSTAVQIDLNLRPLTVDILSREQPLSAGRRAELYCKTTGARPPANISWLVGIKKLQSEMSEEKIEGNETISLLHWMPLKEQNQQILTCKVEHAMFTDLLLEKRMHLNIYYMPRATIHLGSNMNPNDIEEGDDVYFRCDVDANPPVYKIIWEHNGITLQHNPTNGIILTGNVNLVLRNVTKYQSGKYSCTASNVEGDGRSLPMPLQIIYKPVCRQRNLIKIGTFLKQQTSLICEVTSYPPPESFEWILNNSARSVVVDPQNFTSDLKEGRSILLFTPMSDAEFGTLYCRASNLAGQQAAPCIFTLIAATVPDTPINCTVDNITHNSLNIQCSSGYEGGLQSSYIVEAWESEKLIFNSSQIKPSWNLRNLGSKKMLRIVIYAANARGRSDNVELDVETALKLSPRTEAQEAWDVNWAISGVLSGALSLGIVLFFLLIISRLRKRFLNKGAAMSSSKEKKSIIQIQNSSQASEDPDIIPPNKGISDSTPDPPQYSVVMINPEKTASTSSLANTVSTLSPTSCISHNTAMQSTFAFTTSRDVIKPHREVVTKKTAIIVAAQQESCV